MWPLPLSDREYRELVDGFLDDESHLNDHKWLNTISIEASRKGDIALIERLCSLERVDFIISSRDEYGRTPVHYFAKNDDVHSLAFLLDNGADIDMRDIFGRNALHVSSVFGSFSSLQFLLQSAVSVNAIDKNFNTSLHLAARGGYIKCQHQCCE